MQASSSSLERLTNKLSTGSHRLRPVLRGALPGVGVKDTARAILAGLERFSGLSLYLKTPRKTRSQGGWEDKEGCDPGFVVELGYGRKAHGRRTDAVVHPCSP